VAAGADQLGALLLRTTRGLSDVDLRTLERAAQATALLLLNQRSVAEAEQRTRGEFLDDILAHARRDPEELRRRARMLGVDLQREHAVVVTSGGDRRRLLDALAPLSEDRGGLVAWRAASVVLLVPGLDAEQAADLVTATLAERLPRPVTVAAAGPATGAEGLAGVYEDAERCHRVMLALGREGQTATVASLGVYAALFSRAGREDLDRFVDATVGTVLAYDEDRGGDLARTLEAYFAAGGNVTRAARALHVHSNTMYQRLDRIRGLLPRSLDDPEAALQAHLALRIRRLRQET
jgi:DNA-binding PucR family transcriptional regulator